MLKAAPQKNLVFGRQPKPVLAKGLPRLVKPKRATSRLSTST